MSSSNLVRLAFIPESAYGVTPSMGNFQTARFISEAISGTPDTVESQQIRTDRLASGQVVVGLSVEGDLEFELAKEAALEEFIRSAMFSNWVTTSVVVTDLTIDVTDKTITRATGSFTGENIVVGDFLQLANFTDDENNVRVMVSAVNSATEIEFVGPEGMVDGTGTGTSFKRLDRISIGTTKYSFSIEKAFLDLTGKAIIYRGMLVSQMEINIAYGELVSGSFTFAGNGYGTVAAAGDRITFGRTITPPANTNTMNGSVDMIFLASAALGDLDSSDLKLQNLNISLNNNTTPQNVIGFIAPQDQTPGTASIEVSLSAYLTDAAWAVLPKKLTQDSFAIGFGIQNSGGFYGFYMPAVQVSFDDPSSGGQNQDVVLEMSGQAKVGDSGQSSLTIYRSV